MSILKNCMVVLCLLALCACERLAQSKTELRAILHGRNEKLGELFKEGDADKISRMYTDSAKLCPNGVAQIYVGRQAIASFWKDALQGSTLLDMKTETITVDGTSDIIYETGKTTTRIAQQDTIYVSTVKFANVWKKQPDGSYLLDVDIWNSVER
jgi:ketosteroid isomerase-like protein